LQQWPAGVRGEATHSRFHAEAALSMAISARVGFQPSRAARWCDSFVAKAVVPAGRRLGDRSASNPFAKAVTANGPDCLNFGSPR